MCKLLICRLLGLVIAICINLSGCTTIQPTQPNPSTNIFNSKALSSIYQINTLFAQELAKLPEMLDGIFPYEEAALTRIYKLYNDNPTIIEKAFNEMYQEGYPDIRKYCSLLQAFYWAVEKEELANIDLEKYNLANLLNEAWYKQGFELNFQERWSDFNIVTERLNSPNLIVYYEKNYFRYKSKRGQNPKFFSCKNIFKKKVGNCQDYTGFSVYCLRKAGYKAKAIKVVSPTSGKFHVACEFIDKDGQLYVMDVACKRCTHGRWILKKDYYIESLPQIGYGYN